MIRIVADPYNLAPTLDGLVVSTVADYVIAYENLLQAYEQGQDITVHVRHTAAQGWLERLAERCPAGTFVFETVDPRRRLEHLWQVIVPHANTNEEILEAGLLNLAVTPRPGASFEDLLLESFYTPLLATREFPLARITALLRSYDPDVWRANARYSVVERAYRARLGEWKAKARSPELSRLVQAFEDNPAALRRTLMSYRVLRAHKELGLRLLGDDFVLLEALRPNLAELPVVEAEIQDVVVQVTYVLNGYPRPSNPGEVLTLISSLSGLLLCEYEFVERLLIENSELLSDDSLRALGARFELMQARVGGRIALLRGLIRPTKPARPNMDWDLQRMLDWATQSYLPYQAWCDRHDRPDQDLYALADDFACWLYDHWQEIHADSKRVVFNLLPNHASEFRDAQHVNLVLVIDNLCWAFVDVLQGMFQKRGFALSSVEPYLAMLPSETETSKKCLLAGMPAYKDIDQRSYTAITEKGWVPYFGQDSIHYVSDPGKLSQIGELTVQTYVLNYLAVDRALHTSSQDLGMHHADHVQHLLDHLVDVVEEFILKHSVKDRAIIHVLTDHGATRISPAASNGLEPSQFRGAGFAPSPRYCGVSGDRYAKLSDNLREDCFFLDAGDFGNVQHYLCARRANRFVEGDGTFYVHGGLSPEEVVVPHMRFEAITAPVLDLTVLLGQRQYRYRSDVVPLEIGNPNDDAVERISLSIVNSNISAEAQTIDWLNGKSKVALRFSAQFKRTLISEEREALTLVLQYDCHGEKHSQTVRLPIEMRAMVVEKSPDVLDRLG